MVTTNNLFLFIIIISINLAGLLKTGDAACPPTDETTGMKRLGNTRYFIFHTAKRDQTQYKNWTEAKTKCSEKGFKMARIENMTTFAEVGRELEKMVAARQLKDTWYWLDATYIEAKQGYFWGGDTNKPVKFSNYFYRFPRPLGVGSQFSTPYGAPDKYDIKSNTSQCLTLALPLPSNKDKNKPLSITYGHSTTFDERPCEGRKKRHAICESTLPECTMPNTDPYTLSEGKDDYFEKGNWIFGNRKYIINWKQRTINESKKYCADLGLSLYDPVKEEFCLVPHLKMWSRNITVSQFWTSWSYFINTPGSTVQGEFKDPTGVVKAKLRFWANITNAQLGDARSSKLDNTLCVTMQHSYEFRGTQLPCSSEKASTGCHWNFMQFVPANCNNYHGTICQESNKATCQWDKAYVKTPMSFMNNGKRATLPFGYKENLDATRSKFKQTFGNLACPDGYRMARFNNTRALFTKPTAADITLYKYDYLESYWVIDVEGFNKTMDSKCTISTPNGDGHTRKEEKVACTSWNFYLCEKLTKRMRPFEMSLEQPPDPTVKWNEERHARTYPIFKKSSV